MAKSAPQSAILNMRLAAPIKKPLFRWPTSHPPVPHLLIKLFIDFSVVFLYSNGFKF